MVLKVMIIIVPLLLLVNFFFVSNRNFLWYHCHHTENLVVVIPRQPDCEIEKIKSCLTLMDFLSKTQWSGSEVTIIQNGLNINKKKKFKSLSLLSAVIIECITDVRVKKDRVFMFWKSFGENFENRSRSANDLVNRRTFFFLNFCHIYETTQWILLF